VIWVNTTEPGSGLSIFDNIHNITLQATQEGEKASLIDIIVPLPGEAQSMFHVESDSVDHAQVYVSGLPYRPVRIIQGKIPCSGQAITLGSTSPDPVYWAAYALHQALQKQGIEVAQSPANLRREVLSSSAVRQDLCTTLSPLPPPLSKIITIINHESLNSYAEHLLKHFSLAVAGPGDSSSDTKVLKQCWSEQDIDVTGMLLHGGIGLSRSNVLTPKSL
jgi:serine-type D-Ala-D-Ala carboxypeptidase/endopeptidase (penicillin-binding protein 4)